MLRRRRRLRRRQAVSRWIRADPIVPVAIHHQRVNRRPALVYHKPSDSPTDRATHRAIGAAVACQHASDDAIGRQAGCNASPRACADREID